MPPRLCASAHSLSAAFHIGHSRIHGRGLFAAREVAAGERVVEYCGERLSKTASAQRQRARRRVWIFELNGQYDLDGLARENPARFMNHSCEPNCEVVEQGGALWVRAKQAIAAGEELAFDYGYRLAAFPGHRCRCGAPSCAGFIVAQTERRRIRRLLGRQGRSLLPPRAAQNPEALK